MINTKCVDPEVDYRDPVSVLADLAAQLVSQAGGPEEGEESLTDADIREFEEFVMNLGWRALCKSAGVAETVSARVAWRLHCLGVLGSATNWHYIEGFLAPFAWPEEKIALMLSTPLSKFGEMSAEDVADQSYLVDARDAMFQQNGWLVLRVDPGCSTLDTQLGRVAAIVLAAKSDTEAAS
ncbi:MAG: hypothetical protein F2813_08575 [Actinobacteria bacterium]|uniref:Unannotated protein n=1 Tax=freshwater metagenome TaxID=449393 RepID=A0A6J6A1A0_9ZZZZ|nr:hypothetical protein [Mycobacterium sp.]MSX03197.1 hypothetical protein [Actinomycetota bacterium]